MTTTPTVQQETFDSLKDQMGYRNIMQAPRVTKIIIGTGVGAVKDKKRLDMIVDRLAKITGQAPAQRGAKKSIANFKIRTGDIAGYQITLRGARAVSFLDKLIHVVFPRVKDFRGLKLSAIDEMGNISIGFREHTVFPETSDEDAKDVFGLSITIVTTAKGKKEAEGFLRHVGLPLQEN
ncbi:MAG TPA: 50S ribosomal protein L5 [Candidatus Paceibacterota bacterium]